MHQTASKILLWAHGRVSSLSAFHIQGILNRAADLLSRGQPLATEWRLHPQVVDGVWARFGRAEVDLFASRETTHCPLWFSILNDAPPLGHDALAHRWPSGQLYAFPPIPLLQQVLDKVREEEVRVILIAPNWPTQTWFADLRLLLSGEPWSLPARPDLLTQAAGEIFHTDPQKWSLVAWPLKGSIC